VTGSTEVVARVPDVPSKWDVIPIHTSDVGNFKRCRRYWDWTSPTRNNLRRRVDIHGINIPLWFGTGIHFALEQFYDPILKRDPVESFLTWYQYQIDGGVVTEEWLDRTYDIHPRLQDFHQKDFARDSEAKNLWKITGLRELLPAWEIYEEEIELHRELGVGMMTFYKEYAEKNDNFVCVASESTYSIPLGFEAVDNRLDSPNFGKKLEVHARGKRDAILYFPDMDRYGVMDHKTIERLDEDEVDEKLNKDEQTSNYLWATKEEAKLNDYPWADSVVDRIVYQLLRKRFPRPPSLTQKGFPSIDRQKEGTTAEMFQELIVGSEALEEWFRGNEKAQAYYTFLCEKGDENFIIRKTVPRNVHEVDATGVHLKMIAKEMLDDPFLYPNPTGAFACLQCAFRSPCIGMDDGSDWQSMLENGYEVNRDR
jgi:hypothetical protein